MSDKKQRRLPKIGERQEKREPGCDVYLLHAGNVHDLVTSGISKPGAHGGTLPEIGNGRLMKTNAGNIMYQHTGSGKKVSTHFPPVSVKAVAQQQVKKMSKRSSASRHGFEELPILPAVVKQDCSNKEGSRIKRDRLMPVHLPLIDNMTQSTSSIFWSARHKPETAVLRPLTEHNNSCKLPDIKNAQVKHSRPKSGNLHSLLFALPPLFESKRELSKNLKLPPVANAQRAESPEWTKQRKRRK